MPYSFFLIVFIVINIVLIIAIVSIIAFSIVLMPLLSDEFVQEFGNCRRFRFYDIFCYFVILIFLFFYLSL